MNVLIACEFSGIVRDEFSQWGHYAVSADLLPSERPGHHYIGDVRDLFHLQWDLMIAFPPCTHLAISGALHFKAKRDSGVQEQALQFVRDLLAAPIDKVCIENPISIISTRIRKPDQIIQPWMFGHGEVKATCLWLKNLPLLIPTNRVSGRAPVRHYLNQGAERWKLRSSTYAGIAHAMAVQWY